MSAAPHEPALDELRRAVRAEGLRLQGVWQPSQGDGVPSQPDGRPAAAVCMVGNAGSDFWPHFKASPEYQGGQPDPLDCWSWRIGQALAARFGGLALFPFDGPPYLPFQQWALRCEPLQHAPLGLLIHPEFGLWQAFRFALAWPSPVQSVDDAGRDAGAVTPRQGIAPATDICGSCDGQPCLHTCPVRAFTGTSYRVDDCATWLHQPSGQDCMSRGCQARRACPVGPAWRYGDEHAAFHMAAFTRRHGPGGPR